jgi:hypothetical protein
VGQASLVKDWVRSCRQDRVTRYAFPPDDRSHAGKQGCLTCSSCSSRWSHHTPPAAMMAAETRWLAVWMASTVEGLTCATVAVRRRMGATFMLLPAIRG